MAQTNTDLRENHIIGPDVRERIVSQDLVPILQTFGMCLIGLTDAREPFRFMRPNPRFGQILSCLEGEGRVWREGEWARCGPGQSYVTPAGCYHAYEALPGGVPWRLCWVQLIPRRPDSPRDAARRFNAPALIDGDAEAFATAVDGLHREAMGLAAPALLGLWTELVQVQAQRLLEPEGMDTRLRGVWEAVEMRLDYPWTVADMATRADLSEEHVRRLCRSHLGRSPIRHLTYLRMRYAAALLSTNSYTVGAVALKVGYQNDFAFSTAFKRCMGRSPSTFRTVDG